MFNPRPNQFNQREEKEFEEKVVQINRVSKKTKGGNRIGFTALMVVGDQKGRVGAGLAKAADVSSAIRKSITKAKRTLITIPLTAEGTIPHVVRLDQGAAQILLKPAPPGTGLIAGGAVRAVVAAAGIKNLVTKILGTRNKVSNVYATLAALGKLEARPEKKIFVSSPPVPKTVKKIVKTVKPVKEIKKAAPVAKKPVVVKKPAPKAKK